MIGDLRTASLIFADDAVLLISSDHDYRQPLGWLSAKYRAVGMRLSISFKSEALLLENS